jgi:hypothetical protein
VPGTRQILGGIELNRALRTSAVGAVLGLCVSLGLSAAQASPNAAPTTGPETGGTPVVNEGQEIPEVGKAVAESWRVSPGDYLALDQAVRKSGGEPILIDFPDAGKQHLSAAEAQRLVNESRKAEKAEKNGVVTPMAIPIDAFNISSMWTGAAGGSSNDKFTYYISMWNFRDDYVNGRAPDDISGIALDFPSCFAYSGDWATAADYQGVAHNDLVYRSSTTAKSSIYGIRDITSGFKLLTDNGTHGVELRNPNGACNPYEVAASATFEHNQDGNGGWSASIGIGFFNVSYAGSAGTTLRKGTPYGFYDIQ